jgi:tetratricopeptide (TPR) repeat protein
MDCRRSLGLVLCLLGGAVGCQHQVATLPQSSSMSLANQPPPPNPGQIKKASDVPAKEPPAAVLVSWGDFKAGEALAPSLSPDRQQQLRNEARQEYLRALTRDPKFVPAYQGLARLYTAMHDPMHAVETYQKALQIAPNNPALWYELGRSYTTAREFGPALDCLSRAVQLAPDNRECLSALGVVLAENGRLDESLGCFVRAGGEAMGYYRLARTLQYLNRAEQSQRYLAVALQKDPNLTSAQAMRSEMDGKPNPSLQRAAYQEASVPPASFPLTPPANVAPPPQVLHVESSMTHLPASATDAPSPVPAMLSGVLAPGAMLSNP